MIGDHLIIALSDLKYGLVESQGYKSELVEEEGGLEGDVPGGLSGDDPPSPVECIGANVIQGDDAVPFAFMAFNYHVVVIQLCLLSLDPVSLVLD